MAIRFSWKSWLKDAECKLQFTLPVSHTSLELQGKVAWVDEGHAGIKFVEVPQSSQYQLDQWLTERIQNALPDRPQRHATPQ